MRPIKWGGSMGLNAVWVGCHRTPLFQRKIKKVRLCEMTVVFSEGCEVVATAFLFLFETCAFLILIHF